MPNPLSRVNPMAGAWLNPVALKERPDLAIHIVHVINIWSYCDAALTSLLTTFLKSDYRIVHEMLDALVSSEARRAALIAAAHCALSPEDRALFDRVCKAVTASRNTRNAFAHKLWGISADLPDALLLMEPSAYTTLDVEMEEFLARIREPGPKSVPIPKIDAELIAVYRRNELEREVRAADMAHGMILRLQNAFAEPSPARDQARLSLLIDLETALGPPKEPKAE